MTKRSLALVILFSVITAGIYYVYWNVKTKNEMNSMGAQIPTGWLLIIPFAWPYWWWKWCEGVELVSRGKLSALAAFLLMWSFPLLAMPVLQAAFNNVADRHEGLSCARVV